jgi:hypothetical protein
LANPIKHWTFCIKVGVAQSIMGLKLMKIHANVIFTNDVI